MNMNPYIFWQGGPPLSVVVNVGIEIDSSFNLIGRIRGPNVSAGALCLIVTRLLWTLILDLERLIFISKDLQFSCHIHSVWHHYLHISKASVTMLIMILSSSPSCTL
jgi:hypothetical protein